VDKLGAPTSCCTEDDGKFWFTIMNLKKATELFAEPAFDGDPLQAYEPKNDDPPAPPNEDPVTDNVGSQPGGGAIGGSPGHDEPGGLGAVKVASAASST
jgi:type I restriction enzyme R subunit